MHPRHLNGTGPGGTLPQPPVPCSPAGGRSRLRAFAAGIAVAACVLCLAAWPSIASGQVNLLGIDTTPSAWCDEILPESLIVEVSLGWEATVERRTSGWVEETEGVCNRLYTAEGQRLTDHLILIVTSGYSAEGGAHNVTFIGEDAEATEGTWDLAWIDGLGHRAVRFLRLGPLSSTVGELNVSFAIGEWVVELKYMNVDDGLPTKFFESLDEVEELAWRVASRMGGAE